eukprot:scaffold3340_cov114-Isochrysis_galbana.AAC.7
MITRRLGCLPNATVLHPTPPSTLPRPAVVIAPSLATGAPAAALAAPSPAPPPAPARPVAATAPPPPRAFR